MSDRPTENAKYEYQEAASLLGTIWAMKGRGEIEMMSFLAGLARSLWRGSKGDYEMAIALRAVYIKLEEIDRKVTRLQTAGR